MPSGPFFSAYSINCERSPPVLVEGHGPPARVGDPLHVHHDHGADARMLGEACDQVVPPGIARLDDTPPAVEPHDERPALEAQNMIVIRPFSRRWATVSIPLPVRSR